jgi:hypothetical protein
VGLAPAGVLWLLDADCHRPLSCLWERPALGVKVGCIAFHFAPKIEGDVDRLERPSLVGRIAVNRDPAARHARVVVQPGNLRYVFVCVVACVTRSVP